MLPAVGRAALSKPVSSKGIETISLFLNVVVGSHSTRTLVQALKFYFQESKMTARYKEFHESIIKGEVRN